MTVRRPLKLDGTDFKEMTDAEIQSIKDRANYVYRQDPSVKLEHDDAGGNLGPIIDTRMISKGFVGGDTGFVSSFPTAGSTPNIEVESVSFMRIKQTFQGESVPGDTNNVEYPVYFDGTDIRSMTLTDMYDTFINDAIIAVRAEQYSIGRSAPSGYTNLSGGAHVYFDTRANLSAYAGFTTDHANFVSTYYGNTEGTQTPSDTGTGGLSFMVDHSNNSEGGTLYKLYRNDNNPGNPTQPIFYNGNTGMLEEMRVVDFDTQLKNLMRYTAIGRSPYRIRHELGTNSSGALGDAMPDTRLNGSGELVTFLAGGDDYTGTEIPNGDPVTINTYYLRSFLE